MENKSVKKSTLQQLQRLVRHMEENPEFARGIPVFGANKFCAEEGWKSLTQKLNSIGPPTSTVSEWKKTWADLKSRTKKKIAANQKSLKETGGGLYCFSNLTDIEEIIDRTLLLSSAAAPSGKVFGCESNNIDDCFVSLLDDSPKPHKVVAVVTPSRQIRRVSKEQEECTQSTTQQLTKSPDEYMQKQKEPPKRHFPDSDEEPTCSSAKKKKPVHSEQINLIRRQLRVAEQTAVTSKEQADALKRLADAAEAQAASITLMVDATLRMEKILENYIQNK